MPYRRAGVVQARGTRNHTFDTIVGRCDPRLLARLAVPLKLVLRPKQHPTCRQILSTTDWYKNRRVEHGASTMFRGWKTKRVTRFVRQWSARPCFYCRIYAVLEDFFLVRFPYVPLNGRLTFLPSNIFICRIVISAFMLRP